MHSRPLVVLYGAQLLASGVRLSQKQTALIATMAEGLRL